VGPVWNPLGEPWRAWLALLVGVLAVTAQTASSLTVSVLMKSMIADFGWTRSEFATAATVRILAMVAVMPFAGQLTDRFGARAVLGGGALLVGLCVLALASVRSLGQLLAVSVVMGPGQACIGSVAASTLVLRLFHHHRGVAVGVLNGGDNLLNAALPLVAALLLEQVGWRSTLATLGVTYFGLALLVAVTLRADDGRALGAARDASGAGPRLRDMLARNRRLWVLFVAFAAIYAFITSLQLHFHAFQTDSGKSAAVASQLLSIQILVGAVGAPLFGWLAERTSARTALLACVAGLTLSAGLIWNVESLAGLRAWAVWHGLVNSGVVALLALTLHELSGGAARIGGLLGVMMSVCMGATVVGNQWSAWMFDRFHSYVPAWQAYTGLMGGALLATAWLRRAR
jgi:MFS family permease